MGYDAWWWHGAGDVHAEWQGAGQAAWAIGRAAWAVGVLAGVRGARAAGRGVQAWRQAGRAWSGDMRKGWRTVGHCEVSVAGERTCEVSIAGGWPCGWLACTLGRWPLASS